MGRFVATEEKIEEINRLYYEIGVKAEVARQMGCSPSTVSKYIIAGYQPPELLAADMEEVFERTVLEPQGYFNFMVEVSSSIKPVKAFCDYCMLSQEEWAEMQAVQAKFVTI